MHDILLKDSCRDRVFPVATEPARPHVATEALVSPRSVGLGWLGECAIERSLHMIDL